MIQSPPSNYQPESFDDWLAKLPFNGDLMNLIFQLYQYDQLGKATNETLVVKLLVSKKLPRQKLNKENLNQLSEIISLGLIDEILDARNKK